jgi:hypothetical protein
MGLHILSSRGMNYQQRSRALSEYLRTRCEKTAKGLKAACRHAAEPGKNALLKLERRSFVTRPCA